VKRVNVRFLLLLIGILVVGGGLVVALNAYQVSRNAGTLVNQARLKLEEGKRGEALGLFVRYLGMRPGDAEVYAEYAELVLEQALMADATQPDIQRAYNTLEEALRKDPANSGLRRKLAEFQVRIGRFIDAREHLERLRLELEPAAEEPRSSDSASTDPALTTSADGTATDDAVALQLLLARSYYGSGDIQEAARIAADLVGYDVELRQFDPQQPAAASTDAYVLLASILLERLNDRTAADEVLQELIRRREDDADAWLAMSRWLRQTGKPIESAEAVDKAAALAPDNINVVFARFERELARQDLDAAREIAERARELFPGDERVYRGLASIALQRGDLEEAETVLQQGVAILPSRASLLLMLADTLLQRRQLDAVDDVLARVVELYGTNSPAVGLLEARTLMERQQWIQARQRLKEIRPLAVGLVELSRQIDLLLGQCHEKLGEFDEQLEINRRLLVDDPGSLAARVGAASALAAAGRDDEALREFERVAASVPTDRLVSIPQVWFPLLQLRLRQQLDRPAGDRDWSLIDDLVGQLEASTTMSDQQIALLRADVLTRKGENDLAIDLLTELTNAGDADAATWAALAGLLLRNRGPDAVRELLTRVPAETRESLPLLLVEAQLAGGLPPEEAPEAFDAVAARMRALPAQRSASALTSLAAMRLARGDGAEGEQLLLEAAKLQPDDLQSRSALLEMAMNQADLTKAEELAAEIATITGPNDARARLARANLKLLQVRLARRDQGQAGRPTLSADERRLLDDARNLLVEAEAERPNWMPVQRALAEIDSRRGDTRSAIDRLQRTVRSGLATPDVVRQLVGMLYASNRIEEARKAMESLDSEGLVGFERMSAEMELRSGHLDEAVALAERSIDRSSASAGELLWLGTLLTRSGKTDRAGEVFADAVKADPSLLDAWLTLFAHQVGAGRQRAAEMTLERAAEALASPQREQALAQGSEMLGRIDDAERYFAEASAAAPRDAGLAQAHVEFLIRAGRLDAARTRLTALVNAPAAEVPAEEAPDAATLVWARRRLAGMASQGGTYADVQQALAQLGQNAGPDGREDPADMRIAISLLAGRPEPESWTKAIGQLERLKATQPLTMAERLTLAGLLERVGRWDESRNELMSIVSAPKTPPSFLGVLVEKLIDHGDSTSARTWLRRLEEVAPDAPMTWALKARMAADQGDRKAAENAARRLVPTGDVGGEQAQQLMAVARLLESLDMTDAADTVLDQVASSSPSGKALRAEFLGRQQRPAEALDLLDECWDTLALERLLTAGLTVVRASDDRDARVRFAGWLARGRRFDPGSLTIPMLEAELRNLEGEPAEAEQLYRELLGRADLSASQRAMIANNLAFQLATPATAAEAKKLIDMAVSTLGPHPDLLDTRALVHLALGEDAAAVADMRQAVLQPTDVKFLHLAYAEMRVGDLAAARRALEQGIKKGLSAEKLAPADRARLEALREKVDVALEEVAIDDVAAGQSAAR
jgi:tetratricopeptide (TPR) repeat protein